jgi:hypothetical protein
METIKFRGKRITTKQWVYGYLFQNIKPKYTFSYIIEGGFVPVLSMPSENFIEVDIKTIGQFTNFKLKKGREVYHGDIAFTEVEKDHGDIRLYMVCWWIKEWGVFAWLNDYEYLSYIDNGISALDEGFQNTYNMEDSEKFNYAGNIYDNDLIELMTYKP